MPAKDNKTETEGKYSPINTEDIYNYILNSLLAQNIKLLPHVKGEFAGHKAYSVERGLFYTDSQGQRRELKGVYVPTRLYREYKCEDYGEFNKAVRNIPTHNVVIKGGTKEIDLISVGTDSDDAGETSGGNWIAKTYRKLTDELVIDKFSNNTATYKLSRSTRKSSKGLELSLSGLDGAHKVAPQVDWFSPELQQLDPRELLTILPDAEAQMYMYILGRLVCGASDESLMEAGRINHGFAHMAILVGGSGIGKSYTLERITNALNACGYTSTTLDAKNQRFNISKAAEADLTYNDDLTEDTQLSLLTHKNIKSLVSNGKFDVEAKGVDSWETRSRTVFIGLSNSFRPADFLAIDEGMKRRLNFLKVYEPNELKLAWQGKYKDPTARGVWLELAERYDVCETTLALYLLARCKEQFLELTGYVVDGAEVYKTADTSDQMLANLTELRERFHIATDLMHVRQLCRWYLRCIALTIALEPRYDSQKAELTAAFLEHLSFDPILFAYMLDMQSKLNATSTQILEQRGISDTIVLDSLDSFTKVFIRGKVSTIKQLIGHTTPDELMAHLTSAMKSKSGMGYPKHVNEYNRHLRNYVYELDSMVKEYDSISERYRLEARHVRNAGLDTSRVLERILELYELPSFND